MVSHESSDKVRNLNAAQMRRLNNMSVETKYSRHAHVIGWDEHGGGPIIRTADGKWSVLGINGRLHEYEGI